MTTRTTRLATAGAFLVVGALLAAPITTASASSSGVPASDSRAMARTVTAPSDEPVTMIDVSLSDFVDAGAELPPELQEALARDVGLTGAEWLAQSEAGNAAADVVASLSEVIDVVDARLENYDLVVTVESATDARIARSVGAIVEFGAASESRDADPIAGLEPALDLRGGNPYTFQSTGDWDNNPVTPPTLGTFRCSVGFVGIDTVTAQLQMISAGHCEGNSSTARTGQTSTRPTISGGSIGSPSAVIGNAGLHVTNDFPNPGFDTGAPDFDPVPTYYDLGLTPVTNATWVGKPEVVTWGNSTTGAPLASAPLVVRDAGPAIVGSTLCKSGATSGWTCGLITHVNALRYVGSNGSGCPAVASGDYCVGSIQASICVRAGDSGGSALVGSRAVGITSAATNAGVGSCSVSGNVGVFATLYSSVEAFEQVTKVYPDWEPLIGFDSRLTNAGRIDPSVTALPAQVVGGSTRHAVTASIDGGATQGASVASNGNWGVPITGLLGTHTWSASATWGSQAQSTASSGSFLRANQQRLFGADRYQTAIEISEYAFPAGNVPVVYIANGGNFPDALSAGPAATLEGGPLLLTNGATISAAVATELTRLNPETIVIVGGTGVVSTSVKTALQSFTQSATADSVVRLGGASRYETSRLIAQRLLDEALIAPGTDLWVATGSNYPDALSAGAAAAGAGVPILLVNGAATSLDAPTADFIENALSAADVFIAGGTGVVSSGIQTGLNAASTGTVTRAGGADRFATSLLINQLAYPGSGPDSPEAYLTYGFNFPDALAGGVLAGTVGGPLFITQTACVATGIVDHIFTASPSTIVVFGGTAIVSNNARDLVRC